MRPARHRHSQCAAVVVPSGSGTMAELGRSYFSPGRNIGARLTSRFLELQPWRTGGRVNSRAVRSTEKQPSANAERRVENRKREQKMRKNSRDGQGHEHQGNEHQSVQYASGHDPSAAGEATEQIEPANDHHGHTHYADECGLVSNKRRIPEDGLHHSGPNKYQGSRPQID